MRVRVGRAVAVVVAIGVITFGLPIVGLATPASAAHWPCGAESLRVPVTPDGSTEVAYSSQTAPDEINRNTVCVEAEGVEAHVHNISRDPNTQTVGAVSGASTCVDPPPVGCTGLGMTGAEATWQGFEVTDTNSMYRATGCVYVDGSAVTETCNGPVAVSPTGEAYNTGVAVSGTNSASGVVAVGGGAAHGDYAVAGMGPADGAGTGSGGNAAVSALGNADACSSIGIAASGIGSAETAGIAAVGGAHGTYFAVAATLGLRVPFPVDLGSSACLPTQEFCSQSHYQRDCPEVRDSPGTYRILERGFFDWHGCEVVLTYGKHNEPMQGRGWGWIHIVSKHSWGDYERNLTHQALVRGALIVPRPPFYRVRCVNYTTPRGSKRTWHVFVDYENMKGIITAYPRTGHDNCRG